MGYVPVLKEQYKCPHFRILVIGRANAGKTTILEKVCGVQSGTEPIIYDQNGKLNQTLSYLCVFSTLGKKMVPSTIHLTPSMEVSWLMRMDDWIKCNRL